MKTSKLSSILKIISDNLNQNNISYSLIGAIVLGYYGLPRHTSDIDLITEGNNWEKINKIMNKLGYSCYSKTDTFAQFDSQLSVFGNIDFMFVNTQDGKEIIDRSIFVDNDLYGYNPVIQPSDYIVLKLMAIANNPERMAKDETDIIAFLRLYQENIIPPHFSKLNINKINQFADRFGQKHTFEKLFSLINNSYKGDLSL